MNPDLNCTATIEKVLSMKTPSLNKTLPVGEQIQNVFSRFYKKEKMKRNDHRKSFMFLVKWSELSYEELCWEDENVVFHFPFALFKFLGLKLFEISYMDKKPFPLLFYFKEALGSYCEDFRKKYEEKDEE